MSPRPPEIKIRNHAVSLIQYRDRVSSSQRGELIHQALFFLDHCSGREDVERAVQQAFSFHGIDRQRQAIEQDYLIPLMNALSLPQVRLWFAPGIRNLREVEIVDAQGEVHRIDRLIIRDDTLELVDFKVGNREGGYRTQVELYKKLVEAIFARPTQGYLLYIDEPAVVGVP
jgi:ATP-dependent exoDNAse (exonuclease V) beta subunit